MKQLNLFNQPIAVDESLVSLPIVDEVVPPKVSLSIPMFHLSLGGISLERFPRGFGDLKKLSLDFLFASQQGRTELAGYFTEFRLSSKKKYQEDKTLSKQEKLDVKKAYEAYVARAKESKELTTEPYKDARYTDSVKEFLAELHKSYYWVEGYIENEGYVLVFFKRSDIFKLYAAKKITKQMRARLLAYSQLYCEEKSNKPTVSIELNNKIVWGNSQEELNYLLGAS